jgi:hypothetical protein
MCELRLLSIRSDCAAHPCFSPASDLTGSAGVVISESQIDRYADGVFSSSGHTRFTQAN